MFIKMMYDVERKLKKKKKALYEFFPPHYFLPPTQSFIFSID